MSAQPETVSQNLDPALVQRQLQRRNRALLCVLLGFVALFFAISIVKLSSNNNRKAPSVPAAASPVSSAQEAAP